MALLWSARRLALNFLSVEISSGSVPFSIYNTLLKHFVFLFLYFSLHIENSKNKKSHSLPISFAMPLIFFHYKQIFITQNHIHVYISDFYMHLFLIYKNKRVKIKNFFFRLICSLYIQYLSIYFTSILKIAFDVNPPLPVILAYKFSWIWDWIS